MVFVFFNAFPEFIAVGAINHIGHFNFQHSIGWSLYDPKDLYCFESSPILKKEDVKLDYTK